MEKILKAEYEATLKIGEKDLACAVLEDGTRVISRNAIFKAFGRTKRGRALNESRVPNMPSFIDANNLKPFINSELDCELKGIEYISKKGNKRIKGFKADVFPMICSVYLDARRAGALKIQQEPLAVVAEILMQSLSKVGIAALIDEATGYQEVRDKHALEKILEAYITKELMKWQKRFPDEWYENLFRVRGIEWKNNSDRPQYIGRLTNDIIYDRLPKGVLEELKRLNPPSEDTGRRKRKHHQFLTPNIGHPKLQEIITGTNTLMKISPNWRKFKDHLARAFPKHGEQTEIEFENE
ncbi:MAG: P63C domain-containing protein [Lutibacter sp.]|jgi:hypothetical protein